MSNEYLKDRGRFICSECATFRAQALLLHSISGLVALLQSLYTEPSNTLPWYLTRSDCTLLFTPAVSSITKSEGSRFFHSSKVQCTDFHRYHWGFLIGPKIEDMPPIPGVRYHVKNRPLQGWVYEEIPLLDVQNTNTLLARILIAKIEDETRLVDIIRNTAIIQDDPNWRCRTWVADVLSRIAKDGTAVGTAELDWSRIEPVARDYVGSKTKAGRYAKSADMTSPKPTWDLLDGKETMA